MNLNMHYDVIIIGAGGAGLMCAIEAGKRGRKVLVLDHADFVGKKILISGGGRCNFTNLNIDAGKYQSQNKHFCKSAFSQFTQYDFIELVKKYNIKFHEKKLGQQFCDNSAKQIVDMLLSECEACRVKIKLKANIHEVTKENETFTLISDIGVFTSNSLVVATGGLSIPKIGATPFGYRLAEQFGLRIVPTSPALVPFTFSLKDLEFYDGLSGISFDAIVSCGKVSFRENVLITHRGISGPAILQISSYWQAGQEINIKILPDLNWVEFLHSKKKEHLNQELKTILSEILPRRFVQRLIEHNKIKNFYMKQLEKKNIAEMSEYFTNFTLKPNGTEGYRKAEITMGGVNTDDLNAKNLESKIVKDLFFIGEVVDVTGWLGGYNFQWAWSSGFAAGQTC